MYHNTMESRANALQAEELASEAVNEKVQTVHHTGLTVLPSKYTPAGRHSP